MDINQKENNSNIKNSPSLYFHIPFCEKKCIYCDFYSIPRLELIEQYTNSIINEIDIKTDLYLQEVSKFSENHFTINDNLSPQTIYFGGGTPSLLNSKQISSILYKINEKFNFSNLNEFTIEVNPNSIDENKLNTYLELGINRISIGVQSFDNNELKFLGRIHNSEQAINSIELAKKAGFKNISCDIIYSLPEQKFSSVKNSIDTLINLGIQHISAYTLIFEENTPLYTKFINGEVTPNSEPDEENLFLEICEYLNNKNYMQYEISNFTINGYESNHNLNYWRRREYLGFGASAHSYYNNKRISNYSDVILYNDLISSGKPAIGFSENLSNEQKFIEAIYLGLRAEGLDLNSIYNEFNIDLLTSKKELIHSLLIEKKANLSNNKLALNSAGYALCDYITMQFIK